MTGNKSPKGLTLIEILGAMVILAVAMIPVVGLLSSGTSDTDIANAFVFAQNTSQNILNTVLDNVPFDSLRVSPSRVSDPDGLNSEPNVGEMVQTPGFDVASFLAMIGNTGGDHFTRGEIKDERGTKFFVKLFVFPLPVHDPPEWERELCFRYLPRPFFENSVDETGISNWYTNSPEKKHVGFGCKLPYDYPTDFPKRINAKAAGAPPGNDNSFCLMKRLLIRIRWKPLKGAEKIIELSTAKANLSREDL